ncbi:MFS transporter [bacterium]|nr:MFS transporter [bacterium]
MINLSLNKKVLLFGFIFTFFSSFGQSFFLGLFNPSIRSELDISHGQFGTIYAIATICSSIVLIWFGKKIDEYKLLNYSIVVIGILFFSSIFFSLINNIYLLIIAIFLMRFSGQGLMSHTSSTTISRYFNKRRGRALSGIWFGLSSAEFILPILIVFLLTFYSWRTIWHFISIIIITVLPLVVFYTIKNITIYSREGDNTNNKNFIDIKSWKRSEVLKDFKFYIIALNMLALPWIATGVFIYQSFIAESKLWNVYVIPKSFMIYSIISILTLIFSGFLVDKFTSRKLIPFVNIPLLVGLVILYLFDNPFYAYTFFGLMGASNGLANVLGSSLWAEIYGVRFLGGIRALTTALMVFSTAFGTALFGFLIDKGYSIENIAMISALYVTITLIILVFIKSSIEPKNNKQKT